MTAWLGVLFLLLVIVGVLAVLLPISLIELRVRSGNYKGANTIVKKTHYLFDSSGYLNPTFAAYIALKARDIEHAKVIIENLESRPLFVIYMLHITLAAMKKRWDQAQTQLNAAQSVAGADGISQNQLLEIEKGIKSQDIDQIIGFYTVGPFGKIQSKIHES